MSEFNVYAPTPGSGCSSWFNHATSGDACNSIFCTTIPTTCVGDCDKLYVTNQRTPQRIEINDIIYIGTDTGYEILPEGWYVSSTKGTVFNINSSGVLISVNTCSGTTYVTDLDGNYYGTATIGTQTWFTENLRTTRYNNYADIPNVTNSTTWSNLTIGAYCAYNNNNIDNCFGYLYNFYATTNLCPTEYRVPTLADYATLSTYLGGNSISGGKMKTEGVVWWDSPNDGATNTSGFSGYPAGRRVYNGNFNFFGETGTFWTNTTTGCIVNFAKIIQLKYNNNNLDFQCDDKNNGYSVRCIKN
jgi:uncharacterized protein (TIGR02145 family)